MTLMKVFVQNIPLFPRVVCLYVIASTLMVAYSHLNQPTHTVQMSQPIITTDTSLKVNTIVSGTPHSLTIDRLGITLPIIEGAYDSINKTWALSDTAVQFASMTTPPNNSHGNTFLYGHNTAEVLEPVKNIQIGDVLTITTTDKQTFTYTYTHDYFVAPDQTDVLNETSATPRVTLMTCEGFFSESRRLLYFDFKEVT